MRLLATAIALLGRLPRGLRVLLSAVAAVGLFVLSTAIHDLRGWSLVAVILLTLLFAAVAIGLPELAQWQSEQSARLNVCLKADIASQQHDLRVPRFGDTEGVIDDVVLKAEKQCLASLRREQSLVAPPQRGPFNLDSLDEGEADEALRGVTMGDLRRLRERDAAGDPLSDSERATLAAADRLERPWSSAIASVTSPLAYANVMSKPDERTPEQYEAQVTEYLQEFRNALAERLVWSYAERGYGRLTMTLVNPTDRVFESVQVELHLPGDVEAIDAEDVYEPYSLPRSPRPFGERQPMAGLLDLAPQTFATPSYSVPELRVHGPHIDNSASARITFDPFTLRPRAEEPIDTVHLLVKESAGSIIKGAWEVTATNAEGRKTGTFEIRVSGESLPVREMLIEAGPSDGVED